ncbi:MAG: iron ABC transporter permease [Actinomycetales bacterium]|nr:iron ABC transporter permease [Actinomycetales bacterium]
MTTATSVAAAPVRWHSGAPRVWVWTAASACALVLVVAVACTMGPAHLPLGATVRSLLGLPHGLTGVDATVLTQIRVPRVLLAAAVGAALATSGAAYQTVFRNPLADPYLLGVAAGAGFGVTVAVALRATQNSPSLPLFAFVGAISAVAVTLGLGGRLGHDPVSTVLAGVAVASFATALQTYIQQRNSNVLRPVYSWILGQLTTAGWDSLRMAGGYIAAAVGALIVLGRRMDALMLNDDEAVSLGVHPRRMRLLTIGAATMATAAAVSVSGLIGFVGIVVPHLMRYVTGLASMRLLPAVALCGAAFLVLADLGARTLLAPAEMPIGVITAFVGAPFFLLVLRTRTGGAR